MLRAESPSGRPRASITSAAAILSRSRAPGAAASVGHVKQQRVLYAARHYLARLPNPPPCRFDVVAIDGDRLEWLRGAFDAGG